MSMVPLWWQYVVRGGAAILGIVALRHSVHALLGRPVIGPSGRDVGLPGREVRGWSARILGVVGLLCALSMFALAIVGFAQ
jgi:hypothetical protein